MKPRKQYLYKLVRGNVQTFFSGLPPKSKKDAEGEWYEHNPFKDGGITDEDGVWHRVDKPRNHL
tara:strand:- start:508 stop:699 length:192 start_codon:yes stop_codon:yes gene_type:complete